MLNISNKRIDKYIDTSLYPTFGILESKSVSGVLLKLMTIVGIILVAAMFLPWTQNIRSKGYVTTMSPDDRPQDIQALLGGRIEKWYVKEGQKVMEGDTIMVLSEVKEDYLDPNLLQRVSDQINAKTQSVSAYGQKADNLNDQYKALLQSLNVKQEQNLIKLEQVQLKYQSDSIDLLAARLKNEQAAFQLERMQTMYDQGLKSLTDLEAKRLSAQEANVKVVSLENKLSTYDNEKRSLQANIEAIKNEYLDKIAKSQSDRMSALSDKYNSEADINKLRSLYGSYEVRQNNYVVRAPISGVVTEALRTGLGEIIKPGESLMKIIPAEYNLAIEMYIEPMDMPLIEKGQKVRIQFDGWPAIVFSGWPNSSMGTFGGEIFAIDYFISKNGKYRILVSPDPDEEGWPEQLRIGGGANTISLLKNVSVGYELWRQLNGFPADYYKIEDKDDVKTKAPLKKVK